MFTFARLLQAATPLVVETDPLSPQQQREKFHLPPGFEIQLVVSEPEIGQPMNLNFDAQGRLWVTHSIEYPYPVEMEGVQPRDERFAGMGKPPARDRVTVLSGIDDSGKPASIVHFAEGMNIPIGIVGWTGGANGEERGAKGDGVTPFTSGVRPSTTTAIAYSIPNLYRLTDTDGDGLADEREVLFGPFGNLDTHGMVNGLTRYLDGWIYANHGFRNTSIIRGTDGQAITMNSGNTFRFREDGSHAEQYTWGEVNPFGMTFDRWGNLYNADCHSLPITCLIRGAYYQSFGKPHDGLGFGPNMIGHGHGSTGICGPAWYEAEQFPEEYRDCIYLCNPVNGQVHRDRIVFRGSSPWAETRPDFITCDDGWFRPVDVKLGPDGALYVADFYNCIIGHYEVPLDHPRRDRTHGRVWRIVYVGEEGTGTRPASVPDTQGVRDTPHAASVLPDLTELSREELLARIGSTNITERLLATNLLIDREPADELAAAARRIAADGSAPEMKRVHALWILFRISACVPDTLSVRDAPRTGLPAELMQSLADSESPLVRTHLAHVLAEMKEWGPSHRSICRRLLVDDDAHVLRAAVDAAGQHPHFELIGQLFNILQVQRHQAGANNDTHLLHAARIAYRNHVNTAETASSVAADRDSVPDTPRGGTLWSTIASHATFAADLTAEISLGARSANGAALALLSLNPPVESVREPIQKRIDELRPQLIHHVARYGIEQQLTELLAHCRNSERSLDAQLAHLQSIRQGLQERGTSLELLHDWGMHLADQLLNGRDWHGIDWTSFPLHGQPVQDSAFAHQSRPYAGGDQPALFFSSLPKGERRVGILRSDPFEIPETLSFYMAGHNGFPKEELAKTSSLRLRDASTGNILAETFPPRNDLAQLVEWDLKQCAGKRGLLEIVDGDDRSAYAWLAVGKFSLEDLNPGSPDPAKQGAELVASLELDELAPELRKLAANTGAPLSTRLDVVGALLKMQPDARLQTLLSAASSSAAIPVQEQFLAAASSRDAETIEKMLVDIMRGATSAEQYRLAQLLTGDATGGILLLKLVENGQASAHLLTRADVAERLKSLPIPDVEQRIDDLTKSLPPLSEQTAELIRSRKTAFESLRAAADPQLGAELFKKHCAACHQYRGDGNKIGPQLDGVGNRGVDRLLEDVLDPNRNVDGAFRTSVIALTSGKVLSGLKRRDEGATLVFADGEGKEFTVPAAEIDEMRTSPLSLMPANLAEKLTEQELTDLLIYLMSPPSAP